MQVFKRLVLGLSVLMMLGMTLAVQAQTPVTPKSAGKAQKQGGKHGAALTQIPVSALDFAVGGLKADQKTHITQIQDQLKADRKATAGDKTKNAELTAKATQEIEGILTPDQATKLKDMAPTLTMLNSSKAIPMSALADVKLTDDQMSKIKAAAGETEAKIKALPKADRKTKSPEMLAAFKQTVDGILTDTQKALVAKAGKVKKKKAA